MVEEGGICGSGGEVCSDNDSGDNDSIGGMLISLASFYGNNSISNRIYSTNKESGNVHPSQENI